MRLLSGLDWSPGAEVTVEANPEDVTGRWLEACLQGGVTRISLGVQSLDPVVLAGLGRRHDPAAVSAAATSLGAAGLGRYSVDLIYGGHGETDESWLRTLGGVLALDPAPGHVSAYALTVEAGTPLAHDRGRHPDEDAQATRYEMADSVLSEAGLSWYEISNWSRPGEVSRHNLNYWMEGDYVGIGCAAHSHRQGRRWWNVRTPDRYIELVSKGAPAEAVSESLSPAERELEALELAVRTRLGVPPGTLARALEEEPALGDLVSADERRGRLVLTLAGRRLANEVACRLRPDGLKVGENATPAR